jgi:hypothetical protein
MTTESTIKPEVTALAAKIKPLLKIDNKTGVVTVEDKLYVGLLPESITEAQLKELGKHNAQFVAAAGLALGELTLPVMKKNAEIDKVSVEIPTVGGDKFNFAIDRSKTNPAGPQGGDPVEKFGVLSASHTMRAARNIGQYAQVRSHLGTLFAEGLAKK